MGHPFLRRAAQSPTRRTTAAVVIPGRLTEVLKWGKSVKSAWRVLECSSCGFRCHQKCTFPKLKSSVIQGNRRGWICGGCAQGSYWRCGLLVHYDNCLECKSGNDGSPYSLCLGCRYLAHFTCSRLRDGYCWQCRRNSQRAIDLFDWSPAFELRDGRTRTLMATKTVVLHGNGAVSGMEFFLSKGEVVNWTDEDQVRISDGGLLHLAGAFCFPTARRVWCDRSFDDREIYKPCTWACFVLANAEAVHPLSVRWQCLVRYNNKPFPKRIFSACVEHGTAQAINRFTLESSVAKTAE